MKHFVLQTPSLQHLAGVRIVTHLWTPRNVFTKIPQCFHDKLFEPSLFPIFVELRMDVPNWLIITDVLESKLWALPLPERCKKRLLDLIKPLGMENIVWYQYYYPSLLGSYPIPFPPQLCWTMHGTVDYAKTAELMVKDERVDFEKRFEFACINCLEDEAVELFQRMSEERRRDYVDRVRYLRSDNLSRFIRFFTRSINVDNYGVPAELTPKELSRKNCLFLAALTKGNRVMCEYLFQRLNQEEKAGFVDEYRMILNRCRDFPSANLFYYLSLLNEEQQRYLFGNCIAGLLTILLRWPTQSSFMEMARRGWPLMNNRGCSAVLFNVTRKISQSFKDYDYSRLFWECWRMTPADYKRHYLADSTYFKMLIETKEEECIRLFLNEAPSRQILELYNCILNNQYREISEVLMDESAISEAALIECKQTAALKSKNDKEDEEKRLRSQHLSRLIDIVMESRMERRLN